LNILLPNPCIPNGAGYITPPPKFSPPQVATPESYVYGAGFSSDTTGVGERWWELFGDTTLDALVEQALANNRDVAVAAARVQQARANLKTVRAQYLPQIGAEATAEGEYTPETKIVQSYAVEPSLSWEVALFGQLRNAKRAAKAQIASSEWALRGVRFAAGILPSLGGQQHVRSTVYGGRQR